MQIFAGRRSFSIPKGGYSTNTIDRLKSTQYYNELTIGDIKQIRAFGDVTSTDILWPETMFNTKY